MKIFILSITTAVILFTTYNLEVKCADDKSTTTTAEPEIIITLPPDRDNISDPCSINDHLTDTKFTCCGRKKYPLSSFYSEERLTSCLTSAAKDDKIITSAWKVFKCLVDKSLGSKEFSFENLATSMSDNLPTDIQNAIKMQVGIWTSWANYTPYEENDQLKDFQVYADAWSAYYTAENKACVESIGHKFQTDESDRCLNWIMQTGRRGDCCHGIPIPFQLHPEPIIDQYYSLKNFTATQLLTLLSPDYDWLNTTIVMFSDHIAACERTTRLIQQKLITLEDVKLKLEAQTAPDYNDTAVLFIPRFISSDIKDQIKKEMLNQTLDDDYTIKIMKNRKESIYKYVYADEWKGRTYNENKTRSLFWMCQTHFLLSRRYKDVDKTQMCY